MKRRQFRPVGVDALEERLVMTAFQIPFSLVTPPPSQVNPRFLVLTGRAQDQASREIARAFDRFASEYVRQLERYNDRIDNPNADPVQLLGQFQLRTDRALNRLSSDLIGVSARVPFGKVNLHPVLQDRVIGANGVTDTTTLVNTPSLQTRLAPVLGNDPNGLEARQLIRATETLVRSDVKNYINLGVNNDFFRLGRGAILPELS